MATIDTIEIVLSAKTANFKKKVQSAEEQVSKFGKKAKKTTDKAVGGNKNLQKSFTNVAGSIAAVQGPLGPVAGRITAIGAILGRISIGAALATAGVTIFGLALSKLIKNTMGVQTQMLKLEGILKATGNAAGLSLTDIEDLSREIGIATLASTGKVRDAAGILLTFKSISGSVFKDTLRLSQDLAEVGFGDLKTGATQLGKALEDPITGLGALRRVGISFTAQQKEQIKVLTMTGRKVEAQRLILKALDEQVGGAGVKAAKGLAGAIDSLGENFDLFFEQTSLGVGAVDFLTASLVRLNRVFSLFDVDAGSLKTMTQVNQHIKKYKEELIAIQALGATNILGLDTSDARATKIKKVLSELADAKEEHALAEERSMFNPKIKGDDKEKQEHDLKKLREEAVKRFKIDSNRQVDLLGKTAREQAKLNAVAKLSDDLYKKLGSSGKLSQAEVKLQVDAGTKALETQIDKQHVQLDLQERLDKVATTVGGTFASVGDKIADAMARGKLGTLNFTNILQEIVVELQKMIIKVMLLDEIQRKMEERIKGSSRGGGVSLGGILKTVGGIFTGGSGTSSVPGHIGPGAAGGGTVQTNTPTLVGERGPELFVPNGAGSIKNNSDSKKMMGGGSSVNVTQNLNFAVGITNTVRAEVMNMLPAIQNSTISAVANAKQRGGKFSKAFGN